MIHDATEILPTSVLLLFCAPFRVGRSRDISKPCIDTIASSSLCSVCYLASYLLHVILGTLAFVYPFLVINMIRLLITAISWSCVKFNRPHRLPLLLSRFPASKPVPLQSVWFGERNLGRWCREFCGERSRSPIQIEESKTVGSQRSICGDCRSCREWEGIYYFQILACLRIGNLRKISPN